MERCSNGYQRINGFAHVVIRLSVAIRCIHPRHRHPPRHQLLQQRAEQLVQQRALPLQRGDFGVAGFERSAICFCSSVAGMGTGTAFRSCSTFSVGCDCASLWRCGKVASTPFAQQEAGKQTDRPDSLRSGNQVSTPANGGFRQRAIVRLQHRRFRSTPHDDNVARLRERVSPSGYCVLSYVTRSANTLRYDSATLISWLDVIGSRSSASSGVALGVEPYCRYR